MPESYEMVYMKVSLESLTFIHYDADFHPLNLDFKLDVLLARVDFLATQPGGVFLLKALRKEALEEMADGVTDPYTMSTKKLHVLKQHALEEVLAYIAAL
ncbi:MAG: hypothetical protein ACK4F4_09330 [Hylemonella sp.]|uniref:hypothetical protein n=1 Tax=Hylemonella sp. TaxID=2066020 RepID=UPI00391C2B45